jgi:hypothetical protein
VESAETICEVVGVTPRTCQRDDTRLSVTPEMNGMDTKGFLLAPRHITGGGWGARGMDNAEGYR